MVLKWFSWSSWWFSTFACLHGYIFGLGRHSIVRHRGEYHHPYWASKRVWWYSIFVHPGPLSDCIITTLVCSFSHVSSALLAVGTAMKSLCILLARLRNITVFSGYIRSVCSKDKKRVFKVILKVISRRNLTACTGVMCCNQPPISSSLWSLTAMWLEHREENRSHSLLNEYWFT